MHAQEVLAPQERASRVQEVKMPCFCGLPAGTFETQVVENLAAGSCKKLCACGCKKKFLGVHHFWAVL